ncbi:hypothetical protein AB0I84_27850 [Streptomyces spectabilis]|uniref:hypothetical protein n=1 Tax=Streptomyces spectabilis TaxID=68270 RepID=UPI0033CC0A1D
MGKRVAGIAVVTAVVLLTGCGGEGGGKAKDGKGTEQSKASARKDKSGDGGAAQSFEVVLEVGGKGKPSLGWSADTNHFENQVTLPWKKTVTVSLEEAELKSGRLLSLSPQSVPAAEGLQYVFPPCTITVDGKVVDKSAGGEDGGCEYQLKGS